MSLEKDLGRIADALEKIVAAFESGAGTVNKTASKPANKKTDKPADKPADKDTDGTEDTGGNTDAGNAPSLDDTVAALQKYMQANGREAAIALVAKFGAKRTSDIPENRRADFIKEAAV